MPVSFVVTFVLGAWFGAWMYWRGRSAQSPSPVSGLIPRKREETPAPKGMSFPNVKP